MNKVKLLIAILLLSSTVFSQSVTDTSKLQLSYPIAKMIVKDLVKGDSALALLKIKEDQLALTEKKVVVKDSIISLYKSKELNYLSQVNNEMSKIEGWQKQYSELYKQHRKLKVKYRFTQILTYAIVGGLGYLYITK
jgi:hypothetical protein